MFGQDVKMKQGIDLSSNFPQELLSVESSGSLRKRTRRGMFLVQARPARRHGNGGQELGDQHQQLPGAAKLDQEWPARNQVRGNAAEPVQIQPRPAGKLGGVAIVV